MFKFSYNWLKEDSEIPMNYDDLLSGLALQGFEIASIEEFKDDKVIDIEVKANRPDLLSLAGVLREYYAEKGRKNFKNYSPDIDIAFSDAQTLSREIMVLSKDVHEYNAVEILDVDNTLETPEFIVERLKKMGMESINLLVDISNYILLWIGQPIHIFDRDKIDGRLIIQNNENPRKFVTLNEVELEIPKGALIIEDETKPLCLAGMIGGIDASVTKNTKNIIIESANFDHINIRVNSKKLRTSTASSYRFERGVPIPDAETGAKLTAEMVLKLCGGKLNRNAYKHSDNTKILSELELTRKRTNDILGTNLSVEEIASLLNKCFFETETVNTNLLKVKIPYFRLDLEIDVDLIEEVGRMYGYHNVEPQPIKMSVPFIENILNINSNKIRDVLVGFGLIECLNYGFIPGNSMDVLGLQKGDPYYGDITIQNPLSNYYSLMRPTLAYSLISTAVNNLKRGITNIKIFEIGRRFLREPGHEDGYNERNTVACLLSGAKYKKGFGQNREVKHSVFDITDLAKSLLEDFSPNYEFINSDKIKFLEAGASAEIWLDDKRIGCVGLVAKKVLNFFEANVIKEDMFYFEFDFDNFVEKKKSIKHESNYPVIRREYNFLVKNGTHFSDYKSTFFESSELIIDIKPIDVYQGQGVPQGMTSVLIAIAYNSPLRTLESSEIDLIEQTFKQKLKDIYQIELKM